MIGDGVGTGTILDNDQAPVVMVANAVHTEGNEGSAVTGPQTWAAGGSLMLTNAKGMPNAAGSGAPFYLISPGTTDAAPTATGTGSYRGPLVQREEREYVAKRQARRLRAGRNDRLPAAADELPGAPV